MLNCGSIGFGYLNGSIIKYDHVASRLHNPTKSASGKYGSRNRLSKDYTNEKQTAEKIKKE